MIIGKKRNRVRDEPSQTANPTYDYEVTDPSYDMKLC